MDERPEEIVGRTMEDFQPAEFTGAINDDDTTVMTSGVGRVVEERLLRKDRGIRTFLNAKAPCVT